MSAKTRFVHVGFPKSASTTLQNSFFSAHPNIYHVGNGYKGGNNTYADDGVEWVAEHVLRYRKEYMYDAEAARKPFLPHFEAAEADPNILAVGFSSEFFCFNLSNEIDVAHKAQRIHDIFGDGTKIVFIFREQFSMLRSLYLEMIRGGYYHSYRKFIEYTYLYQDRSWCHDFAYHNIFALYAKLFGKENVVAVPFELLKRSEDQFIGMICNGIGVPSRETKLPEMNKKREDTGYYEHLRRLNDRARHEFGSPFYEPFSATRLRTYFHNELGVAIPKDRLADDALRIPLAQTARKIQEHDALPDLELTMTAELEKRLTAIYAPSNVTLMEQTGLDLASFGYRLA